MSTVISPAVVVPALSGFLTDWIEGQRVRAGVPGIQVAIRQGAQLLYSDAFGVADTATGEPLTTAHIFRIASHSKTFTATIIMRLASAGKLRLDDAAGDLVPELAGAPLGTASVRELLGHQSGAQRDGDDANFWQLVRSFPDEKTLLAALRHERVFPANTHFHYSNLAYALLGVIAARAGGESFDDLAAAMIRELEGSVAEPVHIGPELGVGDAGLPAASGHGIPEADHRVGTDTVPPVIAPVHTGAEGPATGFWANAESTTAWLAAHVRGSELLLTDDSRRLMQRTESTITRAGVTRTYGLGWIGRHIADRRVIGHSGGFPGHITQTWGDPIDGLSVSVLTNRIDGPASALATSIIALIDRAIAAVSDEGAAVPFPDVAGRYLSLWGEVSLVPLPGVVLQLDAAAADPAAVATEMHEADGRLVADAEDGFGDAGEPATFERDADGAVSAVTITGITHYIPAEFCRRRAAMLAG